MASISDRPPEWAAADQQAELAAIFAQTAAGLAQVDLTAGLRWSTIASARWSAALATSC